MKLTDAADKLISLLDVNHPGALTSDVRVALISLVSANEQAKLASTEVLAVLHECEDYFDNRADADCDQDGLIPNEEMKILSEVRDAIAKAESK